MANAQGLPQATAALALEMQKQADATRGRELAAADLGAGVSAGTG